MVPSPGLKPGHHLGRKAEVEGTVRVYSKALVEENGKICQRQDRVPRRRVGLSGWR